jgi:hypothetical protein
MLRVSDLGSDRSADRITHAKSNADAYPVAHAVPVGSADRNSIAITDAERRADCVTDALSNPDGIAHAHEHVFSDSHADRITVTDPDEYVRRALL